MPLLASFIHVVSSAVEQDLALLGHVGLRLVKERNSIVIELSGPGPIGVDLCRGSNFAAVGFVQPASNLGLAGIHCCHHPVVQEILERDGKDHKVNNLRNNGERID
jgi:hypothetical protein